jgi:biopolymer transport protein ExbD
MLVSGLVVLGCGESEPPPAPPAAAALGPLELPVSLRSADAAPTDFHACEITPGELRFDGATLLTLQGGRVAPADRDATGLPALQKRLQSRPRARIAISAHALARYETLVFVLQSASAAGIRQFSLQVRKSGAGAELGWLSPAAFQITAATSGEVVLANVAPRRWDDFTAAWEAMQAACSSASQAGGCGYVSSKVAVGGNLKLILHARGQGLNLEFHRVGLGAEEQAAEEKQRQAQLAAHKEDFMQGRIGKTDLEQEMLGGPPATEAAFQFRASEALNAPSVLSAVMRPLCAAKPCGAVVSAEPITPLVRVASLIGAAFPDGSLMPSLAFEMPE